MGNLSFLPLNDLSCSCDYFDYLKYNKKLYELFLWEQYSFYHTLIELTFFLLKFDFVIFSCNIFNSSVGCLQKTNIILLWPFTMETTKLFKTHQCDQKIFYYITFQINSFFPKINSKLQSSLHHGIVLLLHFFLLLKSQQYNSCEP